MKGRTNEAQEKRKTEQKKDRTNKEYDKKGQDK